MTHTLLGSLAVLALVDSTSVATLVIPVWLLLAPGQLRPGRYAAYLATVGAFYLSLGLVLALGARTLVEPLREVARSPVVTLAQLAVGVALVVWSHRSSGTGAVRLLTWRDRVVDDGAGTRPLIVLALSATALEAATMLPYVAAIGALTAAEPSPPLLVVTLAAYCLVMVVPAVVLLGARVLLRRRVEPMLRGLGGRLERVLGEATSWAVGVVGVLVTLDATSRLVG